MSSSPLLFLITARKLQVPGIILIGQGASKEKENTRDTRLFAVIIWGFKYVYEREKGGGRGEGFFFLFHPLQHLSLTECEQAPSRDERRSSRKSYPCFLLLLIHL